MEETHDNTILTKLISNPDRYSDYYEFLKNNIHIDLFSIDKHGKSCLFYLNWSDNNKILDEYYDVAIKKIKQFINDNNTSYYQDVANCLLKTGVLSGLSLELFETMVEYLLICPDLNLDYSKKSYTINKKTSTVKLRGMSLLYLAALKNSIKIVKLLTEIPSLDVNKNTPVVYVIKSIIDKNSTYNKDIIILIMSHKNYKSCFNYVTKKELEKAKEYLESSQNLDKFSVKDIHLNGNIDGDI